jgi:hypothetical protein
VLFTALVLAVIGWRPMSYGVELPALGLYLGYILLWTLLPGIAVWRALAPERGDWLSQLAGGWALGLALQVPVFLLLKVLGAEAWFVLHPLIALPALVAARGRTPLAARDPAWTELAALLGVVVATTLRAHLYPQAAWLFDFDKDVLFHAGNTAELLHRWPLHDPRVSGLPLNYHFFSYVASAGASQVTGLPVATLLERLDVTTLRVALAIVTFEAGRRLAGQRLPAATGAVAAALLLLTTDLGRAFAELFELERGTLGFSFFLDRSVYTSVTTATGLVFLLALVPLLGHWLDSTRPATRGGALLLALLAFAASGTKGTVMPMATLALGVVVLRDVLRRRPCLRRSGSALALLAVAALPMTLFLALGPGSFTSSMFRVDPLYTVRASELATSLGWPAAAVLPLWVAGFFGAFGLGALLYGLELRSLVAPLWLWSAALAAGGAVAALLFAAPGNSQLFFAYNGLAVLAPFAAAGLVRNVRPRGAGTVLSSAAVALLAVVTGASLARHFAFELERDRSDSFGGAERPPVVAAYEQGLAWIRANTPADSILVAQHGSMVLSVHAERRAFHETDFFTGAFHATRWERTGDGAWVKVAKPPQAFPEHVELQRRVVRELEPRACAELLERVPGDAPVYVLWDGLRTRRGQRTLQRPEPAPPAPAGAEIAFENRAMTLFRLR